MKQHTKDCPECDGTGVVSREEEIKRGVVQEWTEDCSNCGGSGEIVDDEYEEGLGDWLMHKHQDEEMDRG